jgi:hypothetical protein
LRERLLVQGRRGPARCININTTRATANSNPLISIDPAFSPERKRRHRAGFRQVRILSPGRKFDHQEAIDERPQRWSGDPPENLHHAALLKLLTALGNEVRCAHAYGPGEATPPS